ncbi:MAG: phospholipase C, phosphocholine-specific [Novosphingobium sp.]
MTVDRRTFLAGASAGAGLAALPAAAAGRAPAGSIRDVEHVVILMQENRAFDHYFGALRGVRGFADPRPLMLPDGRPVWAQRQLPKDGGDTILPFHLDTVATAAGCLQGLDHSWKGSQDRWKHWDVWMPEKGPFSMGHMTRADVPYYYALADQFTICDAYHCSIFGPTGPNRLYHFTGTNGLSVGSEGPYNISNDGTDSNPGADMAKDDPRFAGLDWTPYAARLEEAGVSWRVYQEYDNYSDNPLAYFAAFRNLDRTSSRYRRGRAWVSGSTPENAHHTRAEYLVEAFAADVAADRLPQVSWIVAPFHMCEHPDAPPAYGQELCGRLIAALAANPEVWAKTVFILNYDENDGFFDHMPPPIPATRPGLGSSTADPRGEVYRGEPVGLGPRVPMLIVSPWTRGGHVNSQLFDHTSVLRFLEERFGVREPNISPWRRAICGDLTSAFDFDVSPAVRRDTGWLAHLPDVGGYLAASDEACGLAMPGLPATPVMAKQEPGWRPARPLPYDLDVVPRWDEAGLALRFVNRGTVAAVFQAYGAADDGSARYYTVGAGEELEDCWPADGRSLVVFGPNGFHRAYHRLDAACRIEAMAVFVPQQPAVRLLVRNRGEAPVELTIAPARRAAGETQTLHLVGNGMAASSHPLTEGHRWYDLRLTANVHPGFEQRLAGHFENGQPDRSEPMDEIAVFEADLSEPAGSAG